MMGTDETRGRLPAAPSLLRALRAEARREERQAIAEALGARLAAAERLPKNTVEGRTAQGLRIALGEVPLGPEERVRWDREVGTVYGSNAGDEVTAGVSNLPVEGEADPHPVRLRLFDAEQCLTAWAFLNADEADQVADLLQQAATAARAAGTDV